MSSAVICNIIWGFWNILCPSGFSNSIFINIVISIAKISDANSNVNKNATRTT